MASLAHAIHALQNGNLSSKEFLEQVDRLLAVDPANAGRLWDMLDDEHTRVMLPPDVYTALRRRIDSPGDSRPGFLSGETHLQAETGERITGRPFAAGQEVATPERIKGVGDTLNGRFVLEECIGFGGMGTVYKALDLRKLEASDRKPYIAIKVLNVQFRGHPKSLITLQREARKAQALAHPNIVAVYDFDRDGAMVYLTMEYLSGKPLSQVLRAPGFSGMAPADALRIVGGMGKALAYAHERGFVHCDFKPANVILTDSGEVKVIDFGIARVFRKPEEEAEATVFDPGSLGALTPAYASPEMLEHRDPDPRDDIYALACITYELLTGQHPFNRMSAIQARNAGMRPQRPKSLGRHQWAALKAALSFERAERTPTIAQFLQGLGNRQHSGMLAATAGVVLVLAAAAGGGYYYWRTHAGTSGVATTSPAAVPPVAPPVAQTSGPATATPAPTVESVLAQVPCSALATTRQGGALKVEGYLPEDFVASRLTDMLRAVPGVESVEASVQQVGSGKCGMIRAFAPYWTANHNAGTPATIKLKGGTDLHEGEQLVAQITTPPYTSYVNVDYFELDGSVVHMVPSPRARANQAPPSYAATIGGLGNWVIAKPFGKEMITLLTTPVPLFDGLRPEQEPGDDYLQAVGQRLQQIADKYGADKIAVDFVQITTRAGKS